MNSWLLLSLQCGLFQFSAATSLLCNSELCPVSWVNSIQRGDGWCDLTCNTLACGLDSNFIDGYGTECNSCACWAELGNGICDQKCNNLDCGWDGGDCGVCAEGCLKEMLGNGVCEEVCNVPECVFDQYDCGLCTPDCTVDMIGDGMCQTSYFLPEYQEYGGDRQFIGDCLVSRMGDGNCETEET